MTEERHHARTCAEYAEEQAERLRLARERYCRAVRQHFDLLREAPAGDPGGIETLDLLEQRDRERWPAQQPCDEWSVGDCIADAEELERENQDLHKIPAEIRRYLKDNYQDGLDFAGAVKLGVRALMVTQNKTLTERDLEVAVLDRGKERRKFRRIPPEVLHQLITNGT